MVLGELGELGGTGGTRGTVAFGKWKNALAFFRRNQRFLPAPQNFYEGVDMGGVCASPVAHQFGSVLGIRRSFWGGSGDGSAVYLM